MLDRAEPEAEVPRGPPARKRKLFLLLPLALLLAALAVAGAASAVTNPNCQNGSFNQTWSTPTLLNMFQNWTDDCILVQADVTVAPFIQLRFHDVTFVFDNSAGNITFTIGQGALVEFDDEGDDLDKTDNSQLNVQYLNITWSSFLFNITDGARFYVNDTIITGGGVTGTGLSWQSGIFVPNPTDFAWNHVDHTTFANGLLLIGYHNATVIESYAVSGGVFDLYLNDVGNLTFYNMTVGLGGSTGVMINDSENLYFRNFAANSSLSGFVANRVTGLRIDDGRSARHLLFGFDLNAVVNATLQRMRVWRSGLGGGTYGIELDGCRNITLRDAEITQHGGADLHVMGFTQFVNATNLTVRTGANARGIWIDELNPPFPNRFAFEAVSVTAKGGSGIAAIQVTGAWGVTFNNTTVSGNGATGLFIQDCADILFANGTLTSNGDAGAALGGSNITLLRTTISANLGPGVVLDDGSFTLERVNMAGSAPSIRAAGVIALRGQSTVANSTIPGGSSLAAAPLDAVNITADGSSSGRILFFNNTISSAGVGVIYGAGLYLAGIYRVEVFNNVFQGLPVAVRNTNVGAFAGNTYQVSKMPLGAIPILFESGYHLDINGETFVKLPAPAGLSTVVRAPLLVVDANISNLRLPLADFGIYISSASSLSDTAADIRNVTVEARRTGITVLGITKITVTTVTVDLSTDALTLLGGGTDHDVSVRDVRLQASSQALRISSDGFGTVTVANLSLNRTGVLPNGVVDVTSGLNVFLSNIETGGAAYGINVSEARRIYLTRVNFTDNTVGFGMYTPSGNASFLNWTIDTPTTIARSTVRLNGEVTVYGQPFTILSAKVSIFATNNEPKPSRFVILGASTLTIGDFTNITAEAAVAGSSQKNANFTIENSLQTVVSLSNANLTGLGDAASPLTIRHGLRLAAADITVSNVRFAFSIRPLQAIGIELTVVNCFFNSTSLIGYAVTLSAGASLNMSGTVIDDLNGVFADGAFVYITSTAFTRSGEILRLSTSQATLLDSTANDVSSVAIVDNASSAQIWRLNAGRVLGTALSADHNSLIFVHQSFIGGPPQVDAVADGCAVVTLENTLINGRSNADHARLYSASTGACGIVDIYWTVRFGVCVLSSGTLVPLALVTVIDDLGSVVYNNTTTSTGLSENFKLLEFESQNGGLAYHAPFDLTAAVANLSQTYNVDKLDGSDVIVCLDDVPPLIRVTNPPTDLATTLLSIAVQGFASDDESGLAPGYPCLRLNNATCRYYGVSFDVLFTLVEGTNTVEVIARDNFGNEAHEWRHIIRDTTKQTILWCDPPALFKTNVSTVQLTCQLDDGNSTAPLFSGVTALGVGLSANGTVTATLVLVEGLNAFRFSLSDPLGNIASQTFSWTLDTEPPRPTQCNNVNVTVTNPIFFLRCNVPSDAQSVLVNGQPVGIIQGQFSAPLTLAEGNNSMVLVVVDNVGNVYRLEFWLLLDTTTNCEIFTPTRNPEVTDRDRIVVGGRCDPDVTLHVSTVATPVKPDAAGYWSATVGLNSGDNKIVVDGTDSNGAPVYFELKVTYIPAGPSGDIFILIVFGLVAAGLFMAAFFISRRPRAREPTEHYTLSTGSQKAPPRPAPQTQQLPENREDVFYRPKPPPQHPPPPPPRP